MTDNTMKGDENITVIPYCPQLSTGNTTSILISKLCFWFNNKFNHEVNHDSINAFMLHVKLFGASVYPDYPELGCYAINGDEITGIQGKVLVGEIHYKGEVIYCRC